MRILHVLDHSVPLHSGYSFRTLAILQQQRARGWQTFHLTSAKQGPRLDWQEMNTDLVFMRSPYLAWMMKVPVLQQLFTLLSLKWALSKAVKQVEPDVIHAHSSALNGLVGLWQARTSGLPLVYEVRAFWEDAAVDHGTAVENGLRYKLTKALETFVLKHAHAVTTICQGLKSDMESRGIAADKITLIPNAVDIDKFTPLTKRDQALEQQLNLGDKKVLGFLGSFYAYEGLNLLVEALSHTALQEQNVCLLLVGGGPQESALKQQVAKLGLEDKVIFVGRVNHDQVSRYYSLVDVLVYPRIGMRLTETVTPLKPLEAMAQSKLVVASDVGGHHELIRDGETGYLFKQGSVPDLAETLARVLNSPETWPHIWQQGLHFVQHERNWAASVANYVDVYQAQPQQMGELIDGKPSH
ncbi:MULTISPECIES: TIGR04063 family PEP-CTERM/XrtA system glycosyltransferase [unclassified Motilimonas]|uniref:TIGR04063 family PEP-CTERM/XrtA system glycosyltransferase n=1 Tax=Motilimonas TaxID=1914248 RepID=UPI001E29FC8A|nr:MULTISPECIES: TIGR04063 family PEP-CTERM/XrtA system glycosyltransferase [unclassified Motilimonas]MCE0556610.1 glycosyltransferase, exosortase A system-associated [Motilimonas sp. E26]MDO6524823.1 glycosyltransferase, exosortase A system-associated [Motilimonas sp. 1_MG-2023]